MVITYQGYAAFVIGKGTIEYGETMAKISKTQLRRNMRTPHRYIAVCVLCKQEFDTDYAYKGSIRPTCYTCSNRHLNKRPRWNGK